MCIVPAITAVGSAMGGGFMTGLSTIFTAASGAVSTYSAVQQGNAAEAAANATAKQQEASARQTLVQGEEESDRQRRAGAAMLAQQKVAMAANGIDVSSASAIETLDDTKGAIEEDAFAIRQNARNSAGNLSQMAANSRTEGANAASAGRWGGMSTILSTGATVGAKYSGWQRSRAQQGSYA